MSDFEVALERLLAEHGQSVSESGDFIAMSCYADCAAAMKTAEHRRRGRTTDLRVVPVREGKRQGPATNNAMRTRPVHERPAVKQAGGKE